MKATSNCLLKLKERLVDLGDLKNWLTSSFQLDSAMSMTPFSDEFLGAKVNNIYQGDRSQGQAGVFVNITLQLEENAETSRPSIKGDIQKHLLGVIQRRSNNVGYSALWVDSPPGSVSGLQGFCHFCHLTSMNTKKSG